MSVPAEFFDAFMEFPLLLRTLAEAELEVGNRIVELGHGFPAPPVGACIKLANKLSTQARESGDALRFYERNGSHHSGEFTDTKRHYFVLEPANFPDAEPDMDVIRKAFETKPAASTRAGARESAGCKRRLAYALP